MLSSPASAVALRRLTAQLPCLLAPSGNRVVTSHHGAVLPLSVSVGRSLCFACTPMRHRSAPGSGKPGDTQTAAAAASGSSGGGSPPAASGVKRSERDWGIIGSRRRVMGLPAVNDKRRCGGSDKAVRLINRELTEEQWRPELPPVPRVPRGWSFEHTPGTAFFTLQRTYESIGERGLTTVELLRVRCAIGNKDPEKTYRLDDGERDEPEHFTFTLALSKPRSTSFTGGVEFTMTVVDSELVFDCAAMHTSKEALDNVVDLRDIASVARRNQSYRGPYVRELDEDFVDEMLAYLDERGVNNAFAEFIQQQAHWTEQQEYLHWLKIVRDFADVTGDEVPSAARRER